MRARRLPALLTLLALVSVAPAAPAVAASDAPSAPAAQERIDAFVEDYLDRHGLPGAAISVVQSGSVLHQAGYGHDSEGAPITEETPLRVASVSKSFTAFAVLTLVDGGEVDLDEPVTRYLPELDFDDRRAASITVRHLLSNTSGLPNPMIVPPAADLTEAVSRVQSWPLHAEPGTTYRYSNANFWVAARLVEKVSGRSFGDYLEQHVFGPLGMAKSVSMTTNVEAVDGLATGHVTAYGWSFPATDIEGVNAGSGGMVTTAADMGRWLSMQQAEGVAAEGERVLSAELVRESHNEQPGADGYALGWDHSGPGVSPPRISHSGNEVGFNAQQDLVPSHDLGVAVMLNSFTPSVEHAYEISSGIIAIMEGEPAEPGTPVATIVDLVLGALTLGVLALAVRGLLRARRWADRRRGWGWPRFVVRLLPQLIAPALGVFVFVVLPNLQDNSSTPADVVRLFPAAVVMFIAAVVVGVVLVGARVSARVNGRS